MLNIHPFDPGFPLLGIYSTKTRFNKSTVSYVTAKGQKPPMPTETGKLWPCIHQKMMLITQNVSDL